MKKIRVVGEAKPGVTAGVVQALTAAGVEVEDFASEVLEGTVVATFTTVRYAVAMRCLARAGYRAVGEDALLVRLDDRPGAPAELTRRLRDAGLDLRSVRIVRRAEGGSLVAVSTSQAEEAIGLIEDAPERRVVL